MNTCSGIKEYCHSGGCKKHHDSLKDVTQVAYHVCNKECKNDEKHKSILMSFNDNAPQNIVDEFAVHGVYINKSTDKELKLTDINDQVPKSIFSYDKDKKVYYHAENIITKPNFEENGENNGYSAAKTKLAKTAFYSLSAAILLGMAFTIPQSRKFLLKSFSKVKTNTVPLLKNVSGKIKNAAKYVSNKFSSVLKKIHITKNSSKVVTTAASTPAVTAQVAPKVVQASVPNVQAVPKVVQASVPNVQAVPKAVQASVPNAQVANKIVSATT